MSQLVKYVGLDVPEDTIAVSVAVAEDGKHSQIREHGVIANTPAALKKLLSKFGGTGVDLHILLRGRSMRIINPAPEDGYRVQLRCVGPIVDLSAA